MGVSSHWQKIYILYFSSSKEVQTVRQRKKLLNDATLAVVAGRQSGRLLSKLLPDVSLGPCRLLQQRTFVS